MCQVYVWPPEFVHSQARGCMYISNRFFVVDPIPPLSSIRRSLTALDRKHRIRKRNRIRRSKRNQRHGFTPETFSEEGPGTGENRIPHLLHLFNFDLNCLNVCIVSTVGGQLLQIGDVLDQFRKGRRVVVLGVGAEPENLRDFSNFCVHILGGAACAPAQKTSSSSNSSTNTPHQHQQEQHKQKV